MVIAKNHICSGGRLGWSIVFFVSLFASQALAQSKDCCNIQTGDWISASSAAVCEANPGHVSIADMANSKDILKKMQAVMPCHQKTLGLAQQQMGMPTMPNIPGMPDMSNIPGMPDGLGGLQTMQTSAPQIADCCHVDSANWLGSMEVSLCLAEYGQFPDIDAYQSQVNACNATGGAGGGASTEDIEINIANGGFEQWSGDEPTGFMNFDGGEKVAEATKNAGVDMQAVFKSTDAHTGSYSLLLKAKKMTLPPQAAQYVPAEMVPTTAGGVSSCGNNCADLKKGADAASLSLAVEDPGNYLCGVYKGRFVGGDQLWVNALVLSGGQVIGGTNSGTRAMNFISKNAGQWTEFKMPIMKRPGMAGQDFNRATIVLMLKPAGGVRNIGQSGGKVHEGTQVNIDSVRFCGDPGITLYKPTVIEPDSARGKISNEEEESIGAQTFVNLDNDDENDAFDIDDTGMSQDDNELIKMVLSMPVREFGYVELRQTSGGDAVKVWEDARKSKTFSGMNKPIEAPGFLDQKDSEWVKHLWIEGVKPSTKQNDIVFEFVFSETKNGPVIETDTVSVTILGIESIKWQGKGNSLDDNDTLDADPNWPSIFTEKSLRVFPGKRFSRNAPEKKPRNIVDVKVTLNVKPVRPVEFAFRAIDVDDPSAFDDDVDREDSAQDNRGEAPFGWGGFPDNPNEILKLEFDDIEKTFAFRVTLQPGDNFRIVGGGDPTTLIALENNDTALFDAGPVHTMKITDPAVFAAKGKVGKARVREHKKYVSDVLTVWRKLYLEIDTMGPVRDNEVTAKIVKLEDAGYFDNSLINAVNIFNGDNRRQQWITIDKNLFAELPEESQAYRSGLVDNYKSGTMKLGEALFRTNGNTANETGYDKILVVHRNDGTVLGDSVKGMTITLVDDDTLKNGDVLSPLPTGQIIRAFAPAYVLPDLGGQKNSAPNRHKTAPFRLHVKDDTQVYLKSILAEGFDNKDYDNDPALWVVYLLNAFQGKLNEDGDSENGLSGQTDGHKTTGRNGYGALVFQESGRETAVNYTAAGAGTGWQLPDVAPHEIAHLFGASHSDGGLMSYDKVKTIDFKPITLDKIRSRSFP